MKKIGIIGGVGPLATVDFFEKIVRHTPANIDQDHIPILVYNNPNIPDRTKAILDGGQSPVDEIVKTGQALIDMGADFLTMPCNTAFYFFDQIQCKLDKELVSIVDVTVDHIIKSGMKKVLLLATKGTIMSCTYSKKFDLAGIDYVKVDDEFKDDLQFLIYEVVKKGNFDFDINPFKKKLDQIIENEKVDGIILACTELPILFEKFNLNYNTVDTSELLAKFAVKKALE